MSFLKITNPKKRDAVVADFIATKKRILQRNLDERVKDVAQEEEIENLFKPIIKSNEKSTAAFQKELTPMQAELTNINNKVIKKEEDDLKLNKLEEYIYFRFPEIDPYFSIYKVKDGGYRMGDKHVKLDINSNIYIDDERYEGTEGLW